MGEVLEKIFQSFVVSGFIVWSVGIILVIIGYLLLEFQNNLKELLTMVIGFLVIVVMVYLSI